MIMVQSPNATLGNYYGGKYLGRALGQIKKSNPNEYQVVVEGIRELLENNKSPSRKTGEPDNRASHYYLGMYWAEALANQDEDPALRDQFAPLAKALAENEDQIIKELVEIQGGPADIGGYYHPDVEKAAAAMCPSETLNRILAG